MSKMIDLTGRQVGMLTVVRYDHSYRTASNALCHMWLCRCECGEETKVLAGNLLSEHTISCGCWKAEEARRRCTTHKNTIGKKPTPEYRSWMSMKRRCYNPNTWQFKHYGGRGITVCDRWRNDFAAFLADMGPRPSLQHTLDRVDNNGPYSPENCRWATKAQQTRNSRRCRWLEFNGERRIIREWADVTGIDQRKIQLRIARGWDAARALTTP